MGIKILKPLCELCQKGIVYKPLRVGVTTPIAKGCAKTIQPIGDSINKLFGKSEILTKYSLENGLNPEEVMNAFKEAEKYLDDTSIEQLLRLTSEGKIKLFEKQKIQLAKKRFFFSEDYFAKEASDIKTKPIFSYLGEHKPKFSSEVITYEESAKLLKNLLNFAEEGKIPASEIAEILKLRRFYLNSENCQGLVDAIRSGKVNSKNIVQARLLAENSFSLNILSAKSLDDLSNSELKELANILASKGTNRKAADGERLQRFKDKICELNTPLLPTNKEERTQLLKEVIKKITHLSRVNEVKQAQYTKFCKEFESIADIFKNSKYTIDDLKKAGGIKLKYSREEFKQNVFNIIKDLPMEEQNKVLQKFGLQAMDGKRMGGLPVYLHDLKNFSNIEKAINDEINKFLNYNIVKVPQGYESFAMPLREIGRTFPEFFFAIGSKQHGTHDKDLAMHMLAAFQKNTKHPLYRTLNPSEKRILGISTLLHDINKIEQEVDKMHPLVSSRTVNSIVSKMKNLTTAEKNRIINFVENHHWLTQIPEKGIIDTQTVDNLAYKFRKGNDFTMAKIFAESDLKAVNNYFYDMYGGKINSESVKAIEDRIQEIQAKSGKLIYTTAPSMDRIIKLGTKKQILGVGEQTTENYVIKAKDIGLDAQNFLYHAPDKNDAFILAESGMGYGNEGVFSCSLGNASHSATFQNRKEFFIFKNVDMDNISLVATKNANSGAEKTYELAKKWILNGSIYGDNVRKSYFSTTSKELSLADYAQIYKIASEPNFRLADIHKNKQIQKILGGKKEAQAFEECIRKENDKYLSFDKNLSDGFVPEIVCHDMEIAAIGTNGSAADIDYQLRKRYPLIIEF